MSDERCECHGGSDPDRGGQARARRPRPRRQGHRPRAARRRPRGHLHRPAPDPRADRRDRHPGGRRRHRAVGALGCAHDAVQEALGLLEERDARDIVVIGGGIIPEDDIPQLKELGVAEVFTPGAPTTKIVDWVKQNVVDDSTAPRLTQDAPGQPAPAARARRVSVTGRRASRAAASAARWVPTWTR